MTSASLKPKIFGELSSGFTETGISSSKQDAVNEELRDQKQTSYP